MDHYVQPLCLLLALPKTVMHHRAHWPFPSGVSWKRLARRGLQPVRPDETDRFVPQPEKSGDNSN